MTAKIIYVEGSDYSGKTTFINNVKEKLEKQGKKCKCFKEPSGIYRELLLSDKSKDISLIERRILFCASRISVMEEIYKVKDEFDYIFVDRTSIVSDYVYTHIEGNNNELLYITLFPTYCLCLDFAENIDEKIYDSFFMRNSSIIFLDIDKKTFMERMDKREQVTNDINDAKDIIFKKNVFNKYKDFIKALELLEGSFFLRYSFKEYAILHLNETGIPDDWRIEDVEFVQFEKDEDK